MKTIDFLLQLLWCTALTCFALFGKPALEPGNHFPALESVYYFKLFCLLFLTLLWQFAWHAVSNDWKTRRQHPFVHSQVFILVFLAYVLMGGSLFVIGMITDQPKIIFRTWILAGPFVSAYGTLVSFQGMKDAWNLFLQDNKVQLA